MSAPPRLAPEERRRVALDLRAWLWDELEIETTGLQAEMLLDVMTRRLGPAVYNQALYDAQALLSARIEELSDDILALERATPR